MEESLEQRNRSAVARRRNGGSLNYRSRRELYII